MLSPSFIPWRVNSFNWTVPNGVSSRIPSMSNSSYIRRSCSISNIGNTIFVCCDIPLSRILRSSWDPSSVVSCSINLITLSVSVSFLLDSKLCDGNKKNVDIFFCLQGISIIYASNWLNLSKKKKLKIKSGKIKANK